MKSSLLIFEKGGIFIALEFKSFYKQSTGNELSKCKYQILMDVAVATTVVIVMHDLY